MTEAQLDNQLYQLGNDTPIPAVNANGTINLDFPIDILDQLQQNMFQDYRARLVGVFERDNIESGRPWRNEIICPPGASDCSRFMRH